MPVEMVALVLHDARVEAVDLAADRLARRIEAFVAKIACSAARRRASPGTDRQPSQPSSISSVSGVSTGLTSSVYGTGSASG